MPSASLTLATLEGLVRAEQWCDALEALLFDCPVLLLPEAWCLALQPDPDLLTQVCRAALVQSEALRLQHWWTVLAPTQRQGQQLRARLGEQRLTYVADFVRAAGLALSARALAPGVVPQASALQALCAWVDEAVDPSGLAEALLHRLVDCRAFQPDTPAEQLALLALETLWSLLAAPAVLPQERLARLRLWGREWLLGPQRGMYRAVPVVCVETDSMGLAHDTLEVELHTPGSGQTLRCLQDVLAVSDGPAARCVPDTMDETFCHAIAHAFQAACALAQRTEVDARWRLRRGLHGTPVLAAQGGSASGQALRALYSALTDTWPDPGVLVLAEVSPDAHQLQGVLGVPQKVQAIVQAVQARQRRSSAPASPEQGDPGLCDTLVVASAVNEGEALETLQAMGASGLLRVVWAHTPAEACAVRSRLVEALERTVADGARQFGHTPWYQASTLRFVHLTLLLDQGPDTPGPRWQVAPQTFNDLPALLAHVTEPALVVLGPPGSGKSTLLRHYDLAVTQAALEARTDLRQAPLTFFVALNDYRPQADGTLPAPRAWLAARWAARYPGLPPLDTLLRERRLTLLLDALNEMPVAPEEAMARWRACIREFHEGFPGIRLVFSCRSLDYSASLSSPACPVPQVRIEPLADTQVQDFLQRYSPDPAWGAALWAQLQGTPQLALFRSPYYLYLLVQHSPDGQIPSGRAALFTGFLWQALRREVEQEHPLFQPDMLTARDLQRLQQYGQPPPATLPERGLLLPGLSTLAWVMQQRGVRAEGGQVRLPYDEALACLDQPRAADILAAGTALAVLEQDLQTDTVMFRHQLLQEYCAARRLAHQPDATLVQQAWRVTEVPETLATTLQQLAPSDPLPPLPGTGWEETTVLAAAMSHQPDAFVAALLDTNLPLAGRCAAEPGVQVSTALTAKVRQALVARMQDPTADLRARIAAGLVLGRLGDPRLVRREGPHGAYLEPPMITIPGGTYRIGSEEGYYDDEAPVHEVTLAAFAIGQFLVTNAEWQLFMEAGGYDDARWWDTEEARAWRRGEGTAGGVRQWWQEWRQSWQGRPEEFREWLQTQPNMALAAGAWEAFVRDDEVFERTMRDWYPPGRQTQPAYWHDEAFNNPAQPVVGMCWFEARAYCAWLSAQAGQDYRLPTEVEWEVAARGREGRRYAYGNELATTHCNVFDAHVRRTTPIGIFPGGATPEGVQDLTGNIWEWTSSLYQDYPYDAADGREDVNATSARRVLRGGSWYVAPRGARAAYRDHGAPVDRDGDSGLRLVRVVPFPGSLPTETAAQGAAAAKNFFAPARRLWHTVRRWLRPAGLPGTGSARAARGVVERRSS